MIFNVITFGCKLNQAESEKISADFNSFLAKGKKGKAGSNKSDLIILNACAVTHKAVRECRQKVNQLHRKNPKAKIVVTGCFTEKNWSNVDLWVSNKEKHKISEIVFSKFNFPKNNLKQSTFAYNSNHKNRAFIKVQTGCNQFCAYCIIPSLRGQSQSIPPEIIISEINKKEKQGYKEVVLTGVNIGIYSHKTHKLYNHKKILTLPELLKLILEQTNIPRIRLGSLWPTHINSKLINLYACHSRLCPHFHLSIQSGSNQVLKLMGRTYTREKIINITEKCRSKIPHINFTADIIVGFPGESDKDFQASKDLIKKIGFSKVHIFKYSPRPGTRAIKMPNQVPEKIKQARSRELILLSNKVSERVKKEFINKKLPILWEDKLDGYWYGFTANYIRVKKKVKKGEELKNIIENIKLSAKALLK